MGLFVNHFAHPNRETPVREADTVRTGAEMGLSLGRTVGSRGGSGGSGVGEVGKWVIGYKFDEKIGV